MNSAWPDLDLNLSLPQRLAWLETDEPGSVSSQSALGQKPRLPVSLPGPEGPLRSSLAWASGAQLTFQLLDLDLLQTALLLQHGHRVVQELEGLRARGQAWAGGRGEQAAGCGGTVRRFTLVCACSWLLSDSNSHRRSFCDSGLIVVHLTEDRDPVTQGGGQQRSEVTRGCRPGSLGRDGGWGGGGGSSEPQSLQPWALLTFDCGTAGVRWFLGREDTREGKFAPAMLTSPQTSGWDQSWSLEFHKAQNMVRAKLLPGFTPPQCLETCACSQGGCHPHPTFGGLRVAPDGKCQPCSCFRG